MSGTSIIAKIFMPLTVSDLPVHACCEGQKTCFVGTDDYSIVFFFLILQGNEAVV